LDLPTTGKLVLSLSAVIPSANVYDDQKYQNLVEHLPCTVQYVVADAEYNDWKLYDFSRYHEIICCPSKAIPSYERRKTRIDFILQIQERLEDMP